MNVVIAKGTPHKVVVKAMEELQKVANGVIRPKVLWCRREKVQVLKVGYSHRAVCVDGGKWNVISHETYNKRYL